MKIKSKNKRLLVLLTTMTEDVTPLLHPQPRRPYNLTRERANSSLSISSSYSPTTPSQDFSRLPAFISRKDVGSKLERDTSFSSFRSVLNLTSSTLSGIYTPSLSGTETSRDQPSTPTGDGDQTFRNSIDDNKPPVIGPYERPRLQRSPPSHQHHQSFLEYILPLGLRTTLLFSFGVAYGVIVSHLHDHQQVAPVQLEGIEQSSWRYLMAWGGVGVVLGGLLPWIDVLWEEVFGGTIEVFASKPQVSRPVDASEDQEPRRASTTGSGLSADWHPSVRSIGAFIGIAFAIVRTGAPSSYLQCKAKFGTAQAPLAVGITGIPHLSPREPSALVSGRPLKTWFPSLHDCRSRGDCHSFWNQPGDSALTGGFITTSKCNEHVSQ